MVAGSGSSWVFAALCLLVPLAERGAEIVVLLHYFLAGQYIWSWWTLGLLLPGCFVQALSFIWYKADGHPGCFMLSLIHILQLGILKRHVDCFWAALKGKVDGPNNEKESLMQQGDASLLRLLEAILQALPHLLLQIYIYLTLDETDVYPVVSALLCLLSLSWALVVYSRFLCLLKPGHLSLPWAALLCQLLWRMGMIGTRVLALVVFARVYHFWVFALGGAHWLVMSFWLVAQQTDVISNPCYWRLFNLLFGAVYVFCFINIRDGPSRYRCAVFYVIMLLENIILLLLATDFLQEAMWGNIKLSVAVMSGFLIGCAALIIYYTLLHPKSAEICHSFRKRVQQGEGNVSAFSSGQWHGVSWGDKDKKLGCEELKRMKQSVDKEHPTDVEGLVTWMYATNKHHHWLLLKLAMKTGNLSKINDAFGDGGFGEIISPRCLEQAHVKYSFGQNIPVLADHRVLEPLNAAKTLETKRWLTGEVQAAEDLVCTSKTQEPSTYVTLGNTRAEERFGLKSTAVLCGDEGTSSVEKAPVQLRKETNTHSPDNLTLYFSANTEGMLPLVKDAESDLEMPTSSPNLPLSNQIKEASAPEQDAFKTNAYPVVCVSPILGLAMSSNFQRSVVLDGGSLCNDSTLLGDFQNMEDDEVIVKKMQHLLAAGGLRPSMKGRLIQEEKPCFTSTPKPQPTNQDLGLREDSKARRKLTQLNEKS